MKWMHYQDFNDFCRKEKLTPEEGLDFLIQECKKRGLEINLEGLVWNGRARQ